MIKYQVNAWSAKFTHDYDEEALAEAVAKAETFSEAELIKWYVEPNLPHCKPDFVWRSLRLYTWRDKGWHAHAIHGLDCGSWAEHPMEVE